MWHPQIIPIDLYCKLIQIPGESLKYCQCFFQEFNQIPYKYPNDFPRKGLLSFQAANVYKKFMYRNDETNKTCWESERTKYKFHIGLRKFASTAKWGHTVIFGPWHLQRTCGNRRRDLHCQTFPWRDPAFCVKAQQKSLHFLKISMEMSVKNILKCGEYVDYISKMCVCIHIYIYRYPSVCIYEKWIKCYKWHETICQGSWKWKGLFLATKSTKSQAMKKLISSKPVLGIFESKSTEVPKMGWEGEMAFRNHDPTTPCWLPAKRVAETFQNQCRNLRAGGRAQHKGFLEELLILIALNTMYIQLHGWIEHVHVTLYIHMCLRMQNLWW